MNNIKESQKFLKVYSKLLVVQENHFNIQATVENQGLRIFLSENFGSVGNFLLNEPVGASEIS